MNEPRAPSNPQILKFSSPLIVEHQLHPFSNSFLIVGTSLQIARPSRRNHPIKH
jgi:hypothetical protein